MIFYYLIRGPLLFAMELLHFVRNILPSLGATGAAISPRNKRQFAGIPAKTGWGGKSLGGPVIQGALG